MIDYRYNEDKTLEELKSYIDATYGNIIPVINSKQQNSLSMEDTVKDSVLVMC